MIQRTPLCPHVTHPPRLNARRHTTKSTAAARRHRARRHRAALVDEAGTRDRSSDRAAVERSTASRHQVPRPRLEEKQHACEPLDLTARSPSDDVFRNTWMQTPPRDLGNWISVLMTNRGRSTPRHKFTSRTPLSWRRQDPLVSYTIDTEDSTANAWLQFCDVSSIDQSELPWCQCGNSFPQA